MVAAKRLTWITKHSRPRSRECSGASAGCPRGKAGPRWTPLAARVLATALAASALSWGQAAGRAQAGEAGATVQGSIRVLHPSAAVYVYLITEQHLSKPGSGVAHALLLPQAGRSPFVWFRFTGIAHDRYAIRAFQDVDGNGRLSLGLFGPTEPWCLSWQGKGRHFPPHFDDIAFRVDSDTDVHLALTR